MSMARVVCDHSLWPLGLMMVEGRQTLEQHMHMLEIWDDWFARKERFIPLRVYADGAALEQVAGVSKATKQWLKNGAGEAMKELVSAMAIVMPASYFDAQKNVSVEAVFGVPGCIYSSLDQTLAWLGEHHDLSLTSANAAREIVEAFRTPASPF
ncbi:hypothetical protein [Roseibium algae]|uniref:Uncharacterized protein n=1 Tax=Roseibium algae TaxID=3123038 RepID=A0ABU8TKU0_9HYPH